MTTIELEPSSIERLGHNPYAVSPYSDEILSMTSELVATQLPYMSSANYPDMDGLDGSNYRIYILDSADGAADIARSIEGHVMLEEWRKDPEVTQEASRPVEGNSLFILVVDVSDTEKPKPAASLSIADCKFGPSETKQIYIDKYGDEIVPSELSLGVHEKETGLWDIMAIMALKEYRASAAKAASIWAYSALYELSQKAGVNRWISTMTTQEEKITRDKIGIPFNLIDGTSRFYEAIEGNAGKWFGFHTVSVDEIRPQVTAKIEEYEAKGDAKSQMRAAIARIALNGSLSSNQRVLKAA